MCQATTTSSSITSKKCVRFAQHAQAKLVLHRDDEYTPEEKIASFYTRKELCNLKQSAKRLAATLETIHTDVEVTRGLEHLMTKSRRTMKVLRISAWRAVLEEQSLQKIEGSTDAEMIAMAYSDYTNQSQLQAIQMASHDATFLAMDAFFSEQLIHSSQN